MLDFAPDRCHWLLGNHALSGVVGNVAVYRPHKLVQEHAVSVSPAVKSRQVV